MKVVVSGGGGFLGGRLARLLAERGRLTGPSGREEEIDALVLFDVAAPPELPAGAEFVAGDISDREQVTALVDRNDVSVFHLASIVSHGAELDFDLALRVNLDGGRNVLEACRARTSTPRVVFSSTYAVFGGEAVRGAVGDETKITPQTTYGTTKLVCELLVADYTRKGFLDGRSARLPTVIVRPGAPNPAASAWVSGIFREPLAGLPFAVPVGRETRVPLAGYRTVVDNLVRLHELPPETLPPDRALNLPCLEVTVEDMLAALGRAADGRALGPVEVSPDPEIEAIYRTWASRASFERAERLGLARDPDLDSILRAYLEDFGAA